MRLTPKLLGQHFGELAKVHGIVVYKLSPFEQKAFAGALSKGIPNTLRRIRESVFRVLPPFVFGYLVYDLAERKHHHLTRKNPAEFENEE